MSRGQRQRESLKSGFVVRTVDVPNLTPSTVTATQLPIPSIGAPLSDTGTLRDAPAPWISVWAGIRLLNASNFNAMNTLSSVNVLIEAGLIPYVNVARKGATVFPFPEEPLWTPFMDLTGAGAAFRNNVNSLGQRTLMPWPPGGLVIRVSFSQGTPVNTIGDQVDVCAAWCVNSQSVFGSLPTSDDTVDL